MTGFFFKQMNYIVKNVQTFSVIKFGPALIKSLSDKNATNQKSKPEYSELMTVPKVDHLSTKMLQT